MTYTAFRIAGKVTCIQRTNDDGSITSIPLDPLNTDFQEFVKWEDENGFLDLSDKPYTPPQDEIDSAADRADIRTQYLTAVNRLNQIISAVNPTNAQVIAAVQDLATIQLRVIKLLRWLV